MYFMNHLNHETDNDALNTEFIDSAWIDVKLCTMRAEEYRQYIALNRTKINLNIPSDSVSSVLNFDELDNRNYE